MSNALAVATVTATLRNLLQDAVQEPVLGVPGAYVTADRPEKKEDMASPGVNAYLYQVTPNAAWRNMDLPTRRSNGSLLQRPRAAIDLHYLLSFFGSDQEYEPQRLLGIVVRALHSQPVLTRKAIEDTILGVNFLARSNLADDVESVKFTPLSLSLDELSKLWSVFFQVPYALSVAYQGTVVLIESDDVPLTPLPVRQRNLYVIPFRQPVIDRVDVADPDDPNVPIVMGSTLLVHGKRLRADDTKTKLRIGREEVEPDEVTDTRISYTLSALSMEAGVHGVQVVHTLLMGTPPEEHRGFESNVAPFVLQPTFKGGDGPPHFSGPLFSLLRSEPDATSRLEGALRVNFVDPLVGEKQRVFLFLNELGRPGAAHRLRAEPREAESRSLVFPFKGVEPATYLVRLQVDGAESPLERDEDTNSPTFNDYIGPTVVIQ